MKTIPKGCESIAAAEKAGWRWNASYGSWTMPKSLFKPIINELTNLLNDLKTYSPRELMHRMATVSAELKSKHNFATFTLDISPKPTSELKVGDLIKTFELKSICGTLPPSSQDPSI